eukprot:Protomagalhaensia_wolfi_Nauph_80__3016@NODE_308_length_2840_cov_551_307033_g231_i0_p4_GENE_NODE_308_length_2840_cov_551_307033_g231_i0NODE_308_length_2840_cov_551_307033_g231_i0_p4_ORF_typecomplete_len137_score23_24FeS_biosyn/PF01521_20/6_3e24DUF5403/PF17395_2/2_2e02DUF5403/PF17395_2/2_1_NODE_308_length_2840_cov_551_307033_g231_i021472557
MLSFGGRFGGVARGAVSAAMNKPAVMVSERAIERLRLLLERRHMEDGAVQISVKEKGCAGLAYGIDFHKSANVKGERGQSLVKIPHEAITLLVDRRSLGYLIGSEIDWQDGDISSQFVFKNPNAVHNCPCGRSFAT